MNQWTVAILAGLGLLFVAQVLYVGVLTKVSYHEQLRLILLTAPAVAAFAVAYLAPRRKFLAGLSVAVAGAVIGIVSSHVYRRLGLHVDQIGGMVATFLVLLTYQGVASVVGSAAGVFLSLRRHRNTVTTR